MARPIPWYGVPWQSELCNDVALQLPGLWWPGALPRNTESRNHPSEHRYGFGTQFSHEAVAMHLDGDFGAVVRSISMGPKPRYKDGIVVEYTRHVSSASAGAVVD